MEAVGQLVPYLSKGPGLCHHPWQDVERIIGLKAANPSAGSRTNLFFSQSMSLYRAKQVGPI